MGYIEEIATESFEIGSFNHQAISELKNDIEKLQNQLNEILFRFEEYGF